jgi:alkylhydroperoxidase family enzyme
LARGWNVYLKAVRSELPTSPKLRELGICTVALLTGAHYEYKHHAPDFLTAGGTQLELDELSAVLGRSPRNVTVSSLGEVEKLVVEYAAQMTLNVKVSDAVFDALRQHFDTTQIVELTSAIATYNMVARFLVALGVTPEQ